MDFERSPYRFGFLTPSKKPSVRRRKTKRDRNWAAQPSLQTTTLVYFVALTLSTSAIITFNERFSITTCREDAEDTVSKVGTLDFILLHIFV